MTDAVSTFSESPTEAVKRIGPSLVLTSVLASTLGLVLAQLADDWGDGLLAHIRGLDATVFNNRAVIDGGDALVWAGGFALCLILGILGLFSYPTARGHGVARMTLLWTIIHLLRQAFFQGAMLPFSDDSQLAQAYSHFENLPGGLDMIIGVAGALGLLLVALASAAAFLAFAPHRKLVSTGRRRLTFAIWVVLVPAAASVFLAIPFFSPDAGSGVIPALPLTAAIFVATVFAAYGTAGGGPEYEREHPWPIGLGVMLVVLLLFELLIMRGGVAVDPTQWG